MSKAEMFFAGDFASFEVSGMIFVPVFSLVLYRKCVDVEDIIAIFMAAGGVLCITHPHFIFGTDPDQIPVTPLA